MEDSYILIVDLDFNCMVRKHTYAHNISCQW